MVAALMRGFGSGAALTRGSGTGSAPGSADAGPGTTGPRMDAAPGAEAPAGSGHVPGTGIVDLDREFIEVLSRQRAGETRAADRDGARTRARTMLAEAGTEAADVVPVLLQTQKLLAEQQLQLSAALRAVQQQTAVQRDIAAEQGRVSAAQAGVSAELTALRRRIAKERKLQRAAADYIASHGRHRGK